MKPIAATGLEACYGPEQNLEAFAQAVCSGRGLSASPISESDLAARARQAAEGALRDAQVPSGQRTAGVITGHSISPAIHTALAKLIDRGALASDESTASQAFGSTLDQACRLLNNGEAQSVLVVEVCHHGAGAVVLQLAQNAPSGRTYAVLESLGLGVDPASAWAAAGRSSAEIGYLEAQPLPGGEEADAYCSFGAALTCAVSGGAGSALAALIKAAVCLDHRLFPPLPASSDSSSFDHWQGTPFYAIARAQPWFAPASGQRRAAVSYAQEAEAVCIFLAEPATSRLQPAVRPQPEGAAYVLLPLAGRSPAELETKLAALQGKLAAEAHLNALTREIFDAYQRHADAPYAVVLAGHNVAELRHEVKHALQAVPKCFETGQAWTSPQGSTFTPRPLGGDGLMFVYPGAFNAYVGLGRDLFLHFPGLHDHLGHVIADVGRAVSAGYLYPRSLDPAARADARRQMEAFAADPAAMIETGIMFAVAFTGLLREVFEVRPRAALGYSLGEVSMLWAGGVWSGAEASSAAWRASRLFKTRLFGPKEAVREAWGVRPDIPDLWQTYLLKAPLAQVQACLADEPRVYLTMINLPDEVVIAGEPEGCRRLVAALRCHALPVPYDSVLHNAAMRSERAALAALYSNPVHASGVTFYSAAHYKPLTLERRALANDLAHMTCEPLDFPRLVNAAYVGGARLFVELGPQATCTRWISRILQGRDHAALPINRPRAGDYEGVLSVLAALLSHRVRVNLAPLYRPGLWPEQPVPEIPNPLAIEERSQGMVAAMAQLENQATRLCEGHQAFLEVRQALLRHTAELMHLQAQAAQALLAAPAPIAAPAGPALHRLSADHLGRRFRPAPAINEAAIRAFSLGNAEACFGPAYAVYRGRRLPCLPNGQLQFIHRATSVQGPPNRVEVGASLAGEYDVAAEAWFLRGHTALPYTALMEIALQPCGLLSAYLGSTLPYPDLDFYFRNLEGSGQLLRQADVRGQTVSSHVRLVSASALADMIVQKFEFELATGGAPFYRGTASFGYFTREALANRGRPSAEAATPDFAGHGVRRSTSSGSQLDLLDQIQIAPNGGQYGRGYVVGEARVRPSDWYFGCHFFQDPVMPGSLGVEAMRLALQAFAAQANPMGQLKPLSFDPAVGSEMTWKYRGQITPRDRSLRVEVHVSGVAEADGQLTVLGNANAWNGAVNVYDVKQIGVMASLGGKRHAV